MSWGYVRIVVRFGTVCAVRKSRAAENAVVSPQSVAPSRRCSLVQ